MKFNCNCSKPSFYEKKYSYWEKREITSDEDEVLKKIIGDNELKNKNILHVGIGNSLIAQKLNPSNLIYGITISHNEIDFGSSLNIKNYNIFFCDKYSKNFQSLFKTKKFDLIIDTNLKSYACCNNAFNFMMDNYFSFLSKGGKIITSINGMKWFKSLKPKLSFNIKKLFYYKIKEVTGNPKNILKKSELEQLCSLYGIRILFDEKLCYLIK